MIARKLIAPPLKSLLAAVSPGFAAEWQSRREDRHGQRVMRDSGVAELTERYLSSNRPCVQGGPFAGMQLKNASVGSARLPKLIGSYEMELHDFISSSLRVAYDAIVDIGSAEGFYAVGFAKFGAGVCPVHAFDLNRRARELCRHLAELNDVSERIQVRGGCDARLLGDLLDRRRGLVISDCEGFESEIFTPAVVPKLSWCDILIELHEVRSPGVTDALVNLFSASHSVKLIPTAGRSPIHFPTIDGFSEREQKVALSEFRGESQNWLVGTANLVHEGGD